MTETLDEVREPESDETAEEGEESAEPLAEPQEQPEPPAEPSPQERPTTSEREMEAAVKKLEAEATRHRNRVSEIMGEDAQVLEPCPLCEPAIPGFRWPEVPDEPTRQLVLAAVGMGELAEREHDPEAETCDICRGHGELLTGSKVPTQVTRPCPKCGANGWTTAEQRATWDSTMRARVAAAEVAPPLQAVPPPSTDLPASDAWGRPRGHEFYGRSPVYMTETDRARDWPGVA